MEYQIWSGALPLGSLDLSDEPSPAGWLRPALAYERVLGTQLRQACARIAARGFHLAPEEAERIAATLTTAFASLVLTTADGNPIPSATLELWDDGPGSPGPFVLVTFDPGGAASGARLASHPPLPPPRIRA